MAINDIFQLNVRYDVLGNKMLNVYHYQQVTEETVVSPDSRSLWLAFRAMVVPLIREAQSEVTIMDDVYSFNLFDPTDFWTATPTGTDAEGVRSASVMPTFVAYAFRSNRVTREIRRGQKRIGGMSEDDVAGDGAPPGIMTALNNIAAGLGASIDGSGGPAATDAIFRPVVVKRIPFLDDEGKQQYRLPENLGEAQFFHASSWAYQRVTTQTTRLLGRGL